MQFEHIEIGNRERKQNKNELEQQMAAHPPIKSRIRWSSWYLGAIFRTLCTITNDK